MQARPEEMHLLAAGLEGELTATLHGTPADWGATLAKELVKELEPKVGRLIFNGFPPGVELCDAMNHTGPWPAALSKNSVVGLAGIERWTRAIAYQNAPPELLPELLQ